jgi:hypothetical protein
VYVRDAREQALPLLGGGEHDWNYLLRRADLLSWNQGIGALVHGVGLATLLTGILGGLALSLERRPDATGKGAAG